MVVPASSTPARRRLWQATSIALPLLLAAACVAVNGWVPWLNALLIALLLGTLLANVGATLHPVLAGHARWTKLALRAGIVVFGLRLPVQDVLDLGWGGIVIIVATVAATYVVTVLVGDRMRLPRDLVTLVAAGFAVCGAAAIAAVQDTVRASKAAVATALALVTIFGSILIGAVPLFGALLGMTPTDTGMWAGASIHEVAQVVAASSIVGGAAIAAATTVKLGRVVLLAAVNAVAARRRPDDARGTSRVSIVPWFIVGFLAAVAVRSTGLLPPVVLDIATVVANVLLAAGMLGLGLGIRLRSLLPVPWRAVGLAGVSTATALLISLGLIAILP